MDMMISHDVVGGVCRGAGELITIITRGGEGTSVVSRELVPLIPGRTMIASPLEVKV